MKNAPIILFCYNRIFHLKKTLYSLKKNKLSKNSNLIIFSDGPKNFQDKEKIDKIRIFLKKLSGFKTVTIYENKKNKGLSRNIISGLNLIFKKYKSAIILEDDLLINKNFLSYMNEGLKLFEKKSEVISVHAYTYPINKNKNDPEYFFLKGADCWGWATWAKSWKLFEKNGKVLIKKLINNNHVKEFNFNNSFNYLKMLENQINGKNDSWAIRWYASAFLKNKLTLYPKNSFVKNIGVDGSGTHGFDKYEKFNINNFNKNYKSISSQKLIIQENKIMKKKFEKYFSSNKKRIKILSIFEKIYVKFK